MFSLPVDLSVNRRSPCGSEEREVTVVSTLMRFHLRNLALVDAPAGRKKLGSGCHPSDSRALEPTQRRWKRNEILDIQQGFHRKPKMSEAGEAGA